MLSCDANNKLYTPCLPETVLLSTGTRIRAILLSASASLVDRVPGFHADGSGSIPEQRTGISLQAITHCHLSEIRSIPALHLMELPTLGHHPQVTEE